MIQRNTTGQIWTETTKLRKLRDGFEFSEEDIIPSKTGFLVKLNSLRETDVEMCKSKIIGLGSDDLITRDGVVYAKYILKDEWSLQTQGLLKIFLGILMFCILFINFF
jgi:hypothetical protein